MKLIPILLVFLFIGCKKADDIRVYRVQKSPFLKEAALPNSSTTTQAPSSSLQWDTPKNWKSLPPSKMRLASYRYHNKKGDTADISIVVLSGGGGLLANINRWRGQINLSPTNNPQPDQTIQTKVGKVAIYNLININENKGIAVAILKQDEKTWFFKMNGSAKIIEELKNAFYGLIKSLRTTS